MAKTCDVCGAPSGMYPLCFECNKLKDEGKVVKDEISGKWVKIEETKKSTELTCIICNEPSNGKHFCLKCYKKYANQSVDIRITNCKEIEILDGYGNRQIKCEDGRFVRSKSEKIISDFLFNNKIRTIYEKEVYYYPKDGDPIILKPDFYLPDYDIYIEHNGLTYKSYLSTKEKTEAMYKEIGLKVIVTTEKDVDDISGKLKPILRLN